MTTHGRLDHHLATALGVWPPGAPVVVATSRFRTEPGWDGHVHAVDGVATPDGAVVSVPPDAVGALADARDLADVSGRLALALGRPGYLLGSGVFRWSERPAPLEDVGTWIPADDPRVPEWLRPFGHDVLVVLDDDVYVAGVGLKRHDEHGWEISVGTEPAARGRGLARRLVARAARRVLDEGRIPTYRHADDNHASAAVAEAAGFPDLGWRALWAQPG